MRTRTSDSSRRDNGLLTNPNTTLLRTRDSSGMHNMRGEQNNQCLQPEGNRRRTRFDDNVDTRNITASETVTSERQNYFVAETLTPVRQNAPTNIYYIPNYRDRNIVSLDDYHPRRTDDGPLTHSRNCLYQTPSGTLQGAHRDCSPRPSTVIASAVLSTVRETQGESRRSVSSITRQESQDSSSDNQENRRVPWPRPAAPDLPRDLSDSRTSSTEA
jgi:hypothetical protein